MPVIKIYNIVTNDKYEMPIKCDLVGTREVAEYLGMRENYISRCICTGKWSHLRKKKAVVVGTKEDLNGWTD